MIAVFVLIIIAVGISMFQAKNNPDHLTSILGYKPLSVLSGSMRPLLEPGDLLVAKNVNPLNVNVGDVVTYRLDTKTIVSHRVVEVIKREGSLFFRTRGDANNTDDQSLIGESQLIGKMAFKIPYGGYTLSFIRSSKGFVVFVLLPVFLLLSGEIKFLLVELSKEQKETPDSEADVELTKTSKNDFKN